MSNKLLMNNVVSVEPPPSGTYQQVLGMTPLKVDNTVVGELQEVEILGNTWQDTVDYSNIKHLGELQSDGKYKIYIRSSNTPNMLDTNPDKWKYVGRPSDIGTDAVMLIEPIKVAPNTKYSIFQPPECYTYSYIFQCDSKGENRTLIMKGNRNKTFVTADNCNYITILIAYTKDTSFAHSSKMRMFYGDIDFGYTDYTLNRSSVQTLLLDQPLMKVGDIQDRLFYDKPKGEYVLEKNIWSINTEQDAEDIRYFDYQDYEIIVSYEKYLQTISTNEFVWEYEDSKVIKNITNYGNGAFYYISFDKNYIDKVVGSSKSIDIINFIENGHPIIIYYHLKTPQLIPTGIKQEMRLASYNETTHLFVEGGLNGGIKANIPVPPPFVQDGLYFCMDNRDFTEETYKQNSYTNRGKTVNFIRSSWDKSGYLHLQYGWGEIQNVILGESFTLQFNFKEQIQTTDPESLGWEYPLIGTGNNWADSSKGLSFCIFRLRQLKGMFFGKQMDGEGNPIKNNLKNFCLVGNKNKISLYINSTKVSTINYDLSQIETLNQPMLYKIIGSMPWSSHEIYDINNILLYTNKALTDEEVKHNYDIAQTYLK